MTADDLIRSEIEHLKKQISLHKSSIAKLQEMCPHQNKEYGFPFRLPSSMFDDIEIFYRTVSCASCGKDLGEEAYDD